MEHDKLSALTDFLTTDDCGVCLLEGQAGSFKTELVNKALSAAKSSMLVFRFKCFEASTLDDIYLAFLKI